MQERLDALSESLSSANSENSELHKELEAQRIDGETARTTLQEEKQMALDREAQAQRQREQAVADLRRQVQRTQEFSVKYDAEVLAHADAIKQVDHFKTQYHTVQTTVQAHLRNADVARADLLRATESFERMKDALQKELQDLKNRRVPFYH